MNLKRLLAFILFISWGAEIGAANIYDPRSIALLFAGFHMIRYGCAQLTQKPTVSKDKETNLVTEKNNPRQLIDKMINLGLIGSGLGLILTAPYCVSSIDHLLGPQAEPTQDNYYYFLGGVVTTFLAFMTFRA